MRYDVRVLGRGSRFELERDEPLVVGEMLQQFTMLYEVQGIRPLSTDESEEFDAVAEVEWRAGPAQAE
jgi:hypothetical protein